MYLHCSVVYTVAAASAFLPPPPPLPPPLPAPFAPSPGIPPFTARVTVKYPETWVFKYPESDSESGLGVVSHAAGRGLWARWWCGQPDSCGEDAMVGP